MQQGAVSLIALFFSCLQTCKRPTAWLPLLCMAVLVSSFKHSLKLAHSTLEWVWINHQLVDHPHPACSCSYNHTGSQAGSDHQQQTSNSMLLLSNRGVNLLHLAAECEANLPRQAMLSAVRLPRILAHPPRNACLFEREPISRLKQLLTPFLDRSPKGW